MTELQERLQTMANETFGVDVQAMRDGASYEEMGVDSLMLIEFAIDMQREFDMPMEDGELKAKFTIAETAELLTSKGAAA
ncbi:MAG: acyl carrier protein [Solirubrobacteraceae bacterium]